MRQTIKTGITQANRLNSFIYDNIDQGIDITYESYIKALENEGKTSDEIDQLSQSYESDSRTVLIGQWTKDSQGKYIPDTSKEFAAIYDSDTGIVCVEWSKTTKLCHHTSPCYVMADGSGFCGDLDTEGISTLAYSLPEEYFNNEQ